MTDFDKLIKEKAEQAEYSYKPSAWRQFQRKSGLRHAATRYWVAGVTSAIIVGGIVGYVGYRQGQGTQSDNQTPIVSVVDTLTSQPENAATDNSETFVVKNADDAATVSKPSSVQNKRVQENPATTEEIPPVITSNTKKVTTPRYGRPLVIDVDTIKENVPTDEELRNGNSRLY